MAQHDEHSRHDVSRDADDNHSNTSNGSYDSASSSEGEGGEGEKEPAPPSFRPFTSLPPELRAQIWRTAAAISCPGINFFNVHAFPGDHPGVNRSDSPPWLYLDVRRLAIEDSDEKAARYDPSVWQARAAVRQTCREARDVCAIPAEKRATVVLTRPRRGLFVRAGDEQLRWRTPAANPDVGGGAGQGGANANDRSGGSDDDNAIAGSIRYGPKVTRKIEVHVDDILCLALENCSFNMPYEEDSDTGMPPEFMPQSPSDTVAASPATPFYYIGWSYDPQLTPLPGGGRVPRSRFCVSISSEDQKHVAMQVVPGMLAELPDDSDDDDDDDGANEEGMFSRRFCAPWLILVDNEYTKHTDGENNSKVAKAPPSKQTYRDRFGNAYVSPPATHIKRRPGDPEAAAYNLARVGPERSDIWTRYVRSARLRSAKRPVSLSR